MARRARLCFALLLAGYSGCSHMQLRGTFQSRADDWKMYGGDIGRTNVALDRVMPPLKLIWESEGSAGFSATASSLADGVLFIGNLQGEVQAVDAITGHERGVHDFGSAIVGTPVIEEGLLYVALAHDDESLLCYDLALAKIIWRARLGDIESSPLLLDGHLYVTAVSGGLFCIEKERGEINWKFEIPSTGHRPLIHSSPATDGKIIVFGSDDGNLYGVDIATGKLRWKASTGGSILASPSIDSGTVLVGSLDNSFSAFNLETGSLLWKRTLGGKIYGSQAVNEDYVYVGTAARTMHCLNKRTGSTVWEFTANGVINVAPVISGNILYVVCVGQTVYALNALTGEEIWRYKTEGRIKCMPLIWHTYVFVFAEDRSVLAFTPGTAP